MKLIHFSDTHLGFADYTKIDPEMGINQREADVYRAFSQVTEYIEKNPPDIIIHSGDLFETPRPSNRAINFALRELFKLSQIGIPLILISGNHSAPRVKSSSSIFEAFRIFDNVYPVYSSKYEEIVVKDIAFHCIPHVPTEEELHAAFASIRPSLKAKYNVIVSHTGVTADVQYKMGEFNELMTPFATLAEKKNFDYIALGHYHKYHTLTKNACYSGSTERFSFREADEKKGFIEADLSNGRFKFIPITVREMAIFNPIDCQGLNVKDIESEVEIQTKGKTKDKIVQITFDNIQRHLYVELNFQRLKKITADALYAKWVINWAAEKGMGVIPTAIGTLPAEFENFLHLQKFKDLNKEKLLRMGLSYLSSVQEQEEA
ncbi:MAG: exonuclease SbcCD subunit D [Candidatus Brocadiales bacterium]|nr:exonuclease SbcCD subunit D [Candidatus Bathyanammoxibius amoris]